MDLLKRNLLIILLSAGWIIGGCQTEAQQESAFINDVSVKWELLTNSVDNGDRYRAAFTLENLGDDSLRNSGWKLYFNYRHDILEETTSKNAEISFVNGDFFRLTPTTDFELAPGQSAVIEYEGRGNIIKDDRAPQGLYFVMTDDDGNEIDISAAHYSFNPLEPEQVRQATGFVPDVSSRFQGNQQIETLEWHDLQPILPTPSSITYSGGTVTIDKSTRIYYEAGLQNEARYLANTINRLLNVELAISENRDASQDVISLQFDENISGNQGEENYQLDISGENGIQILGVGAAGVFYGIQSLLNLIPIEAYHQTQSSVNLPVVSVNDGPRFPYRGMHLDVSRNFNEKEAVFKLLDLMAFYKLNKFHFHLTDDEGWRIEIEELPELTEVGAYRGHTLTNENHLQPAYGSGPYTDSDSSYGSGYYTREDYIDILEYAHDRHIEVIPEFDVPGHARAAIKAMENRYHRLMEEGREEDANEYLLNDWDDESVYLSAQEFNDNVISVCRESAYRFFETVVDDMLEMHQEAGVPLHTIHMGGDEVPQGSWERSPLCAEFIENNDRIDSVEDLPGYFVERLTEMLADRNLVLAGWQEIAMRGGGHGNSEIDPSFAENDVVIYSWDNFTGGNRDLGYRVANAGYPVVLCNATNLYFELAYNRDPVEPGDYFGGFVDSRKAFEFMPLNFTDPFHENGGSSTEYAELTPSTELNIKGIQGHLWSEPIKGADSLEYFYAPKILGLAERAWADQPEWESMPGGEERTERFMNDWTQFANRIGQMEMPKMDYLFGGYNYRLPLPGAIIENGMLRANVEFPGLTIRYTTDGSTPTNDSNIYEGPVEIEGDVKLRTFNSRGRGSRVVTIK